MSAGQGLPPNGSPGQGRANQGLPGHKRLRAPREHGSVLIDPPLADVPRMVAVNQQRRAALDYQAHGRSLAELAERGRADLVAAARRYTSAYRTIDESSSTDRLFLAGHQPELFHPGVWFKNFVLSGLARGGRATAVNLVIDSDTIKHVAVRVPGGSASAPVVESTPFDSSADEIPFEEREIEDRCLFNSFGQRAGDTLRPLVSHPLLSKFWPIARARAQVTPNLGECLSQARHVLEGEWGLSTLELPQSQVCALESFHWFTVHLLSELPRLRDVYNAAIDAYRVANRVRSANHPAPNLAEDGEWIEAPFWLWSTASPRRRRLFVRRQGDRLTLSNRRRIEFDLPLTPGDASAAVEVLADLPRRGIKLRSRALITTLFARLMLSDLFIHGIGGAKYDQLTDEIVRRFFGVEPPEYLVLSATLHLTGSQNGAVADETTQLDSALRDLEYHPEKYLDRLYPWRDAPVDVAHWVDLKARWLATEQTRENARQRCHAIRAANEALQAWVEAQRRDLLRQRQEAARTARARAVLASREYAFCLYPEEALRDFLLAFSRSTP